MAFARGMFKTEEYYTENEIIQKLSELSVNDLISFYETALKEEVKITLSIIASDEELMKDILNKTPDNLKKLMELILGGYSNDPAKKTELLNSVPTKFRPQARQFLNQANKKAKAKLNFAI